MEHQVQGRLLIYIQNLNAGGAQPVMIRLANEYKARGVDVELVINNAGEGVWKDLVSPEVKIHDLRAKNAFSALIRLAVLLRKLRPEALMSAMTLPNLLAVAASHVSLTRVPVIISERHVCSSWLAGLRPSRRLAYGALIPLLYRRAGAITAVAEQAADDLASLLRVERESIIVIYNSLHYAPEDAPLVDDRGWFSGSGVPVIVSAGRLEPQKNFDVLIHAFAILHRSRLTRLVILGAGRQLSHLAKLANDLNVGEHVFFGGQVPSVMPYLRKADLFVLASQFEGFPNVLLEALASGVRIVSTDCPSGPREILADGKYGSLVPVGDAASLAAEMARVLDEPSDPASRIARAQSFTFEEQIERFSYAIAIAIAARESQRCQTL